MKFTKKLSLFIMFLVIGTFFSKNSYSKEKSSNSYYEYTTEKIKIYSDENKKENIGTLIKGTRVNVFVTKEIIKKSKDKNGKEIEKKTIMKKIVYKDDNTIMSERERLNLQGYLNNGRSTPPSPDNRLVNVHTP